MSVLSGVIEVVEDVEDAEMAPDEAGHSVGPHSRSVRQQPPPRDTGQALKPLEHERVVCGPV